MGVFKITTGNNQPLRGGATREAGLAKLRALSPEQSAEALRGLRANLVGADGTPKHGVLKLRNSSSTAKEMEFARMKGLDRLFSKANTFRNTSSALQILMERSGLTSDQATALINEYCEPNGQIKYSRATELIQSAQDLAKRNEWQAITGQLEVLCAGTTREIIHLTSVDLQRAASQISQRDVSDNRYYHGENPSLQRADQILCILEDSTADQWNSAHYEIFGNLAKIVESASGNHDFQGVAKRCNELKIRSSSYLESYRLRGEIKQVADRMEGAGPVSVADSQRLLQLLDQATESNVAVQSGRGHLLRSNCKLAMMAINSVLAHADGADEIKEIASRLRMELFNNHPAEVLKHASERLSEGFPDVRRQEVTWLEGALMKLLKEDIKDVNEIPDIDDINDELPFPFSNFSESVNLFLHAAARLEQEQPQSQEFRDSVRMIREAHNRYNDVAKTLRYVADINYFEDGEEYPGYVFPLNGGLVLTCEPDAFEAWVAGTPTAEHKNAITVYRVVDGDIQNLSQGDLEANRMEGLASLPLFAKGLAAIESRVAANAVNQLIGEEASPATRQLFREGLIGRKTPLSESRIRSEISPVFERIWGEDVIPEHTAGWDELSLGQDHLHELRNLMPADLGDNEAMLAGMMEAGSGDSDPTFAKFLFNLSAVYTKLGSASIWGTEKYSVTELRLYGYLLLKESFRLDPDIVSGNDKDLLVQNYKTVTYCAQVLSVQQMNKSQSIDRTAYMAVVPAALRV